MERILVKWKSPDPGIWTKAGKTQLRYALRVNMTEISVGMAFGFAAFSSPTMSLEEAVVEAVEAVTMKKDSWVDSALFLATPLGCILCGIVMDWYGRWIAMLLCKVPLCVGWLYTAMASNSTHLIIGRVITGFGCGMAISPPRVYITEFALSNVRGVLSAFPPIATAIGITLQASLGIVFHWKTLCIINALYTLVLIFWDFYLPETPYFLLTLRDATDEIEESLRNFRGSQYNAEEELKEMLDFKEDNNISTLSRRSAIIALFHLAACKPFAIITGYIFLAQLSGVNFVLSWTVEILNDSMTTVNPNFGYIGMSTTRFLTGILAAILLYKVSRMTLAVTSSLGVGLSCLAIFFFVRFAKEPSVFPQIAYLLYASFATLGYITLPYTIMVEVYPLQVRGMLSGITLALTALMVFAGNLLFPLMRLAIGVPYMMLVFGIISFLGVIYVSNYLPETQNLTLQEIEEFYNGSRPTLVSQRHVKSVQLLVNTTNVPSGQSSSPTTSSNKSNDSKDKHTD